MTDPRAGRTLDREIAKIMGWTPIDAKYLTQLMSPPSHWGNRGTGFVWFGGTRACEVPHFSTLIADAMPVLDKMAGPGFRVLIEANGAGQFDVEWQVGADDEDGDVAEFAWECVAEVCDAESLPLALCLAALQNVPGSRMQGDSET